MATILIVDDAADNREFISYMLSREHKIIEAQNGYQAIAMVEQHQPDIVITDLAMPEMDGIELVKQIRAQVGSIKVIACSGYFESNLMVKKMLQAGADLCLKLPIDIDVLTKSINKISR